MVFNSFAFAPFLAVAVASQLWRLPWAARKACLIALSYLFYAAWYPWALSLLIASTLFDFHVAKSIERASSRRLRGWLLVGSILLNLGVLFSFKYSTFAVHNLNGLFDELGVAAALPEPNLLLPVGISFFTFMSLSYVTDVCRGERPAERSLLDFALFLSFFPHLVAGPIVRAGEFLPQCKLERRPTSQMVSWGVLLLALGLFQKVVLADTWFAPTSDKVFGASVAQISPRDAWLGTLAFSGQIYCDFAGYSTCAIGAAACMGFQLPENFKSPYTAIGFSDFWRRWHITLSRWLRDYVYISLGGNRKGSPRTWVNLVVTMLLGGLWHGASWTFVVWGGLHGMFLCVERALRSLAVRWQLRVTRTHAFFLGVVTFACVTWAWVFFRAPSLSFAVELTKRLLGSGQAATQRLVSTVDALLLLVAGAGLIAGQWLARDRPLPELIDRMPRPLIVAGLTCVFVALATMAGEDRAFIYFQF